MILHCYVHAPAYIHIAANDQQAVQLPANKPAIVIASFVNPLNATMTSIKFYVEGSGLLSPQTINTRYGKPYYYTIGALNLRHLQRYLLLWTRNNMLEAASMCNNYV